MINYELVLKSLPDNYLVITADDNKLVKFATQAYLNLSDNNPETGESHTIEQLHNKSLDILVNLNPSEEERERSREILRNSVIRVLETGTPTKAPLLKYAVHDSDGNIRYMWWVVIYFPIKVDGEIKLVLMHVYEVTSVIDAQNKIKQMTNRVSELIRIIDSIQILKL